ncbi:MULTISPECIES: HK97 family phage prohead protease [unclassified Corallococcus]|uniref:HK97 family phage prohead protease n=1 Tax=unclassified Corallococcus TaxID=2685029 RepID=UPI001A8E1788|nr:MULTISPECIES: HK97 family phage prohead protease [unclassified Corallococcus]WAS89389.1 HK97 family phage prohead protease [Corallococcus sp. NCRR]
MRKPTRHQKLLSAATPAEGAASAPIFRITSPNLDRHRDRVLAVKSEGEGAEVRVPLLWEHNSWTPAIGFARCYREGDAWVMAPVFDEVDELSKTVAGKVKAGSLFTCSIGFSPVEEPVPNAEGGFDYPMVELLEVSIVNVPANADAVRLRSAGTGRGRPNLGAALKALVASQAAVLAVLKAEGDAPEDVDEPDEESPPEGEDKAVGDESEAPGRLTPQGFAEGLLAHLQAGAQMVADFLADADGLVGGEHDLLVWVAEGAKASFDQSISDLEAYLSGEEAELPADGEEQAASASDDEGVEASEEDLENSEEPEDGEALPDEEAASEVSEDEPTEEEAKALRLRVRKHLGFSVEAVAALTGGELRRYAALTA